MKNNRTLYDSIVSDVNIYGAIYSMDSYIFEKGLLSEDDIKQYYKLTDKYNFDDITLFIEECKEKLEGILADDAKLFDVQVYFKLKKLEGEKIVYRPIHSTDLITQVCIVAILNVIMYDDTYDESNEEFTELGSRRLSSLSKLIPSNFYGNLPSPKAESAFSPWGAKYQEYSETVIEKYNQYKENKTYTHEVSLDFKDFFPSIDPKHIYHYIIDKLSASYDDNDMKTLKIAVSKLLYCKITNIGSSKLREKYYSRDYSGSNYAKGILQGLPQGYFFGNICMIELSKCIAKYFPGEALYYVDDSVIYTNEYDKFKDKLEQLNSDINNIKWSNCLSDDSKPIVKKNVITAHAKFGYRIELHKEEKSYISALHDAQWGLAQLRFLAGGIYNINSALFLSTDEIEDATTKNKLSSILGIIDKEVEKTDAEIVEEVENSIESDKIEPLKSYRKLLVRYWKFCSFRLKLINTRVLDSSNDILNLSTFTKKYLSRDNKELFFKTFEKDIFEAELGLLINNSENDSLQSIEEAIQEFERSFTDVPVSDDSLYYSRDITGKVLLATLNPTRGDALSIWAERNYKGYHKKGKNTTIDGLHKAIKVSCRDLSLFNGASYARFVCDISTKYQRKILNAIFSQIINVDNSDAMVIQKRDSRPLRYFELRLLVYLRNPYFDSAKFVSFAEKILSDAKDDNNVENIDYQIIEILYILISKVKDPEKVDSLILVHKLVKGLWKNGSKFLHFYTLHNEEHSIALIKNTIKLVNTIDYIAIKKLDYYILFLACYLHDVSMVIHPNMNSFCSDLTSSDLIYSEWIESMSKFKKALQCEPKSSIKKHILDYFEKVYSNFENSIRNNHAKESAAFIKFRSDSSFFKFIDNSILQIVANISESHGYYTYEVYGRKSHAKSELYSVKYMMVLIRFADLLDLAKDRVSYYILKENIAHMSPISQFHWISHYVTDRCEFKAEYVSKDEPTNKNERWLTKGAITEVVQFDLYLNTKQLTTPVKNGCKCDKYVSCEPKLLESMLTITIPNKTKGNKRSCNAKNCTLLCKWMTTKHEYLFMEIHALVRYLNTVNSGLFTTNIVVNIHYDNKRVLDPKMMDSVVAYLN